MCDKDIVVNLSYHNDSRLTVNQWDGSIHIRLENCCLDTAIIMGKELAVKVADQILISQGYKEVKEYEAQIGEYEKMLAIKQEANEYFKEDVNE